MENKLTEVWGYTIDDINKGKSRFRTINAILIAFDILLMIGVCLYCLFAFGDGTSTVILAVVAVTILVNLVWTYMHKTSNLLYDVLQFYKKYKNSEVETLKLFVDKTEYEQVMYDCDIIIRKDGLPKGAESVYFQLVARGKVTEDITPNTIITFIKANNTKYATNVERIGEDS